MAVTFDFAVYAQEDVILTFTLQPPLGGGISGMSFVLTVRSGPLPTDPLTFQKNATITDAEAQQFSFVLSAADLTITPATYYYDVWRTNTGSAGVAAIGRLIVNQSRRV